jgi:hypothetical protein
VVRWTAGDMALAITHGTTSSEHPAWAGDFVDWLGYVRAPAGSTAVNDGAQRFRLDIDGCWRSEDRGDFLFAEGLEGEYRAG